MNNALLSIRGDQDFWDAKQLSVLKDQLGLDEEIGNVPLAGFLHLCQRTALDPFTKQIYLVGRWNGKKQRTVFTSQTSIDGYRIIAQRSREYTGQTPTEWCGPDGVWVDVWLPEVPPSAARVGVYRKGFEAPVYAVAKWTSYVQKNKKDELTGLWKSMPEHMLAKCAEALALRKAFPQDLSGLYTAEEMGQSDGIELGDDEPVKPKKRTAKRKPVVETPEPELDMEPIDAEVIDEPESSTENEPEPEGEVSGNE